MMRGRHHELFTRVDTTQQELALFEKFPLCKNYFVGFCDACSLKYQKRNSVVLISGDEWNVVAESLGLNNAARDSFP